MSEWQVGFPVDFVENGDRTNQAVAKFMSEFERVYALMSQLRCNFSGAGFPASPVRNQLYVNPNSFAAMVFAGVSGDSDWRPLVCVPARHDLDKHNAGTAQDLQDLVTDAFVVFLASAPSVADSGKVLAVDGTGKVVLSKSATLAKHGPDKHNVMSMAELQGLVSDRTLVYLAALPTAADSAKIVSIDSNGNYVLTSPASQTDALNAPYEKVKDWGTLSADTTIAASDGNIHTFTVGAAISLTLNANCLTGFCRTLTLVITNGGAFTVTWPASVKWAGGSAPTFSAAGVDVVTLLTVDGGVTWLGSANGVSYA